MLALRYERPFRLECLEEIRLALMAVCAKNGIGDGLRVRLITLAEEVGSNVMDHSGANYFELALSANGEGSAVMVLKDDGIPFDTVEATGYFDEPFISESVERHMGLWMISRLTDGLSYEFKDGKTNCLTYVGREDP